MAEHDGATLRIPEKHKAALTFLASLGDAELAKIEEGLRSLAPCISVRTLVQQLRERTELPETEASSVVTLLVSLTIAAQAEDEPAANIATKVAARAVEEKLGIDPTQRDAFASKLARLLDLEGGIGLSARAIGLVLEHERTLVRTRILTDMRPVFAGKNPEPAAAMIVHTLKVESHKEEGHVSHFFALDIDDLRDLRDTVDRAIRKEESLKRSIAAGKLSFIDSHVE